MIEVAFHFYLLAARDRPDCGRAKSPNYEAGHCGAAEKRIGTQVRETVGETLVDPTGYEQRKMATDKAYKALSDLLRTRAHRRHLKWTAR